MNCHPCPPVVFCFDRDDTVNVNTTTGRETVPLAVVKHLAHDREAADVWATGNQVLSVEAQIPGSRHSRAYDQWLQSTGDIEYPPRYTIDVDRLIVEKGMRHGVLGREARLRRLQDVYCALADRHGAERPKFIVIDDVDLTELSGFEHYFPWDFMVAIRDQTLPIDVHDNQWTDEPFDPDGTHPGLAPHYPQFLIEKIEDDIEQPGDAIDTAF